jgi:hypothetical protein
MTDRQTALDRAARHAAGWLDSLATCPVPPRASVAEVTAALGPGLPDGPTPAGEVIDLLARACDPGLTAVPSGRFYGMVVAGAHPAWPPPATRSAMGMHGEYFIRDPAGDPLDTVPEVSRRARAVPVRAVLRALGRDGVAALVDGFCATFGTDERTADVTARLMADGTAWMTGSRWRGQAVLRVSVSNWSTTDDDVARSLAALSRAAHGSKESAAG